MEFIQQAMRKIIENLMEAIIAAAGLTALIYGWVALWRAKRELKRRGHCSC